MAKNFEYCLGRVLKHEGGYSNHPADPGGATNYGITIAVARANGYHGDMRHIPMGLVKQIYRKRYWDVLRCDDLPAGVDYAVFDYGVNSGVRRSARILQLIVGVDDDGRVGSLTIFAANAYGAKKLIEAICDERLLFLRKLRTWPTFGRGWSRRVADVRRDARAMIGYVPPPDVEPVPPKPEHWIVRFIKLILSIFKRR